MGSRLVLKSYDIDTGELIDQWIETVSGALKLVRYTRESPPTKFVIATDLGECFVCKYDGELLYRVDVGFEPEDIAVNEVGRLAVLNTGGNTVKLYDENGELKFTFTPSSTPALQSNVQGIGYQGDKLYSVKNPLEDSNGIRRFDVSDLLNPTIDWNIGIPHIYPTHRPLRVSRNGKPFVYPLTGGSECAIFGLSDRGGDFSYYSLNYIADDGSYNRLDIALLGTSPSSAYRGETAMTLDNVLGIVTCNDSKIRLARQDGKIVSWDVVSIYEDVTVNHNGHTVAYTNGKTLYWKQVTNWAELEYSTVWYETLDFEHPPIIMTEDAGYILVSDGSKIKVFDSSGTLKYQYDTLWSKKLSPLIRQYTT